MARRRLVQHQFERKHTRLIAGRVRPYLSGVLCGKTETRSNACAVPILYSLLLWACRDAFRTGRQTSLSRAIAFLSDDYDKAGVGLCWELFSMTHKLILSLFAGILIAVFARATD